MINEGHHPFSTKNGIDPYGSMISRSARLLGSESENLRAALGRALQQGESAIALRIAARLWGCWWTRGRFEDALQWLPQALGAPDTLHAEERLAGMFGMVELYVEAGNFTAASRWCDDACRIAAVIGSEAVVPGLLAQKAVMVLVAGGDAAPLLIEAIERADHLGDSLTAAEALCALGDVRMGRGDHVEAGSLIDRALSLLSAYPDEGARRVRHLASRSLAAHLTGDNVRALAVAEEAVTLARASGDVSWMGSAGRACANAGLALAAMGNPERASAWLAEALEDVRRSRIPLVDADCLVAFGAAALLVGDAERASRILAAARSLMAANGGAWRTLSTGALYLHYVRRTREALPLGVSARARDEGRAMSREQAIQYALSSLTAMGAAQ